MDKRLKNLNIKLPYDWQDISADNPNGPPTFTNMAIADSGVLQISLAEYLSGKFPNPRLSDLVDLSKNIGLKNEFGDLQSEASGNCAYGLFGSAQFSNHNFPHISIWHLSDGKNFVFATLICTKAPDQKQLNEVNDILMSMKRKPFLMS